MQPKKYKKTNSRPNRAVWTVFVNCAHWRGSTLAIYKTVMIIFPLNLQTITITLDVVKWRWGDIHLLCKRKKTKLTTVNCGPIVEHVRHFWGLINCDREVEKRVNCTIHVMFEAEVFQLRVYIIVSITRRRQLRLFTFCQKLGAWPLSLPRQIFKRSELQQQAALQRKQTAKHELAHQPIET